MSDPNILTVPPTPIEIAAVLSELPECEAKSIIRRMAFQIDRLKAGAFTPEELQGLCHSGLGEDDIRYDAFCNGCTEYQRKLFGKSREDDLIDRLTELRDIQEIKHD